MIALIVAICAVVAVLAAGGIYCVVTEQSVGQAAKSIFSSNDELIVGKWQSQKNPGLNAYVFYDDGSYDSYISTVNFKGKYTIKGSTLTITNPSTNKDIVYSFSVNEKELSLTLVEEDGAKPEEKEVSKYDRVDELNQKSVADLLGELVKDKQNNADKNSDD